MERLFGVKQPSSPLKRPLGQVQGDVPWHRTAITSPLHQWALKVPSGKKYLAVAVDTSD